MRSEWVRWSLLTALIVTSLALATAGIVLHVRRATAQAREVTGTVRCASGAPVQGVWVGNAVGGGDFAAWWPVPADPATARYRMTVRGDRYQVHVGCGGTLQHWAVEAWSPYVDTTVRFFLCQDGRPERPAPCEPLGSLPGRP